MKLKVKKINFETGNIKVVVLNSKDAEKLGQKAGERVLLKISDSKISRTELIAIIDISYTDSMVAPGEIGVFLDTFKNIENAEQIKQISVHPAEAPDSFAFIQKKVKGKKLDSEEINSIINDAVSGHLSQIELATFITGVSINGMDDYEMTALTLAETKSGEFFNFGPDVFDKHSTYISS